MVIIFMAIIVIAIIAAVFTPMLTMYSAIDNL
jgi:type IV pilus assembly protein PilC